MSAPDFFSLIAQSRGMPEGWRWYEAQAVGSHEQPREHRAFMLRGGVPSVLFKSGPRKGQANWSKAEHQAELVITYRDLDAFTAQWEIETGLCSKCGGSGQESAGWSKVEGAKYRDCTRCSATGKPAGQVAP
jgi:hypothetical protein